MNEAVINEYKPDYVSPPGTTLVETLQAIGSVQQACGARTAVVFAQQHLVMEVRRARELIQTGRFLQDMTLVDVALAERRLSWSKVLILMRVVMTHNQQQWIELAEKRSCRELRIDVARAVAGRLLARARAPAGRQGHASKFGASWSSRTGICSKDCGRR